MFNLYIRRRNTSDCFVEYHADYFQSLEVYVAVVIA